MLKGNNRPSSSFMAWRITIFIGRFWDDIIGTQYKAYGIHRVHSRISYLWTRPSKTCWGNNFCKKIIDEAKKNHPNHKYQE